MNEEGVGIKVICNEIKKAMMPKNTCSLDLLISSNKMRILILITRH